MSTCPFEKVCGEAAACEPLETGEEAELLWAQQLHPLTTLGSTALKARGKVPT